MVTHEKEEHVNQVPGRKKQIQFSKKKVRTLTAHSNNPDKSKGLLSLSLMEADLSSCSMEGSVEDLIALGPIKTTRVLHTDYMRARIRQE
jgi:hypothetical protein